MLLLSLFHGSAFEAFCGLWQGVVLNFVSVRANYLPRSANAAPGAEVPFIIYLRLPAQTPADPVTSHQALFICSAGHDELEACLFLNIDINKYE